MREQISRGSPTVVSGPQVEQISRGSPTVVSGPQVEQISRGSPTVVSGPQVEQISRGSPTVVSGLQVEQISRGSPTVVSGLQVEQISRGSPAVVSGPQVEQISRGSPAVVSGPQVEQISRGSPAVVSGPQVEQISRGSPTVVSGPQVEQISRGSPAVVSGPQVEQISRASPAVVSGPQVEQISRGSPAVVSGPQVEQISRASPAVVSGPQVEQISRGSPAVVSGPQVEQISRGSPTLVSGPQVEQISRGSPTLVSGPQVEQDRRPSQYVPAVVGCAPDVAGCAPAVAGCAPAVAGCAPAVVGCAPAVAGCAPAVAGCAPAVVGCAPAVVGRSHVESEVSEAVDVSSVVAVDGESSGQFWTLLQNHGSELDPHKMDVLRTLAHSNAEGKICCQDVLTLIGNKRSDSFRRAILHGKRDLCDQTLLEESGLDLTQRLIRHVAYETLPREIDRKWFYDNYTGCPPPWFMIAVTVVEVAIFVYYGLLLDRFVLQVMHSQYLRQNPLVYHPQLRAQAWRYLSYIFMHAGIEHLGVNVALQLLVGVPLEMVHGALRIGFLYVAGILAGSLAVSVADMTAPVVGASGGVYAIVSAHLANIVMNWSGMKCHLKILRTSFTLICMSLEFGRAVWLRSYPSSYAPCPHPSFVAHLGGVVVGLTLGVVILRNYDQRLQDQSLWWIFLSSFVLFGLFALVWNVFVFNMADVRLPPPP